MHYINLILTCCIVADHTEKKHYWCNICLIWFLRYDYHKKICGCKNINKTGPDQSSVHHESAEEESKAEVPVQPAQPELKIESNLRLESIVLESSVENS